MPSQPDIDQQLHLLAAHRANLAHYQYQLSLQGLAYVQPAVIHGIREARAGIAQCKAALRGWGLAVEDHPDDAGSPPAAPPGRPDSPAGSAALSPEGERALLDNYLEGLIGAVDRVALRGLDSRLDTHGADVSLERVSIMLATESLVTMDTCPLPHGPSRYFVEDDPRRPPRPEHDPAHALPDRAVLRVSRIEPADPAAPAGGAIERALLASEAARHERLLLLGEPGGGKSTFLRTLALALARRQIDPAGPRLVGWEGQPDYVPVLISLRALAERLSEGGAARHAVAEALRAEIELHAHGPADGLLRDAMRRGLLLLCDGLDEVPEPEGAAVDRAAVLRALHDFARGRGHVRMVVTCRTRALDERLRALAHGDWQIETLAPFTLGQIRHFVAAWYREGVRAGRLRAEQADDLGAQLLRTIAASPRLTAMAATPLLLTMMALLLFNHGELPRDRPQLYERILELLLGQWDHVRSGQRLGEAVGLPDWGGERFRPLLDRLSYQAHLAGAAGDGRGRLLRGDLYPALVDFFRAARVSRPLAAAERWLDYVDQRSGLLAPDGPDSYVFAHLTLQEHCAGRHIALNSENPVALVMQQRHDDRWREPIFLGVGLLRPAEQGALLHELIEREGKERARWYRDLILAAELGADRDWGYLGTRMVRVERIQRALRAGLAALLADREQPLPAAERVRAGFLLGDLGDPRYPVTLDQWRRELGRARDSAAAAEPAQAYFCRLPGAAPRWCGRYPITNQQLRAWAQAAGGATWRRADHPSFNRPNQPAIGVGLPLAVAFCDWLSHALGAGIRLPSEAEWLAAAYGDDGRSYPWGDTRERDRAAIKDDQSARGWPFTVPVGCYPAGASAVGALDMAGNVWEWTSDVFDAEAPGDGPLGETRPRALRGGGYRSKKSHMLASGRIGQPPGVSADDGFRVMLDLGDTPSSG